jgi:hypothetical protein
VLSGKAMMFPTEQINFKTRSWIGRIQKEPQCAEFLRIQLLQKPVLKPILIILAVVTSLSGCASVRQHWADGFGTGWNRSYAGARKYGPDFLVESAFGFLLPDDDDFAE